MNNQTPNFDKAFSYIVMSLIGLIVFLTFPQSISKLAAEGTIPSPKPVINYFASTTINAKAAFVYDLSDKKVLYQKNAFSPLPLASLTKIMTAIIASELAPTTTVVTIDKNALDQNGDSGLLLGERWNISALLKYTLVVSSNDGATAIAEAVGANNATTSQEDSISAFVNAMNAKARSLNLVDTTFQSPNGLDLSTTTAGAEGSAADVATMLIYGVNHHYDLFSPTKYPTIVSTSLNGISHTGENTNILIGQIPHLIAGKTGNTDIAGGNLAVVFDANSTHRIVIVVLGSTYEDRFSDVKQLVDTTMKSFSN